MNYLQKLFSILYEIAGTKNLHLAMMILILIFLLFTKTINSHIIKGPLTPLFLPIVDTSVDLNYIEVISHSIYELISKIYFYIIVFIIGLLIYFLLYKWRSLPITFKSAFFFLVNYAILILYSLTFIMLIQGIPSPIYIEDLSLYSQYKYFLFVIAGFIGILIYSLRKKIDSFQQFLILISFPYLKEEIRLILNTWKHQVFGDLFCFVIIKLDKNLTYKYVYFTIKYFCTFFIPFIQLILLLKFSLIHGDLCYLLYMTPLSFLSWILNNLDYYFLYFFEGTTSYIRSILKVTIIQPDNANEISFGIITTKTSNIYFNLTREGISEGYNLQDIEYLSNEWLQHARLFILFERSKKYLSYFCYINLFLRIFCWITITLYFFYPLNNTNIESGIGDLITAFARRTIRPPLPKRAPLDAYKVKKNFGSQLEKKTNGDYKHPHPVITDFDEESNGEVPLKGSLTHGTGSPQNPSVPLHRTEDPNGPHPAGQLAVIPQEDTSIPKIWLESTPIKGAQAFFKNEEVKSNVAKHMYKEEENT